MGQFADFSSRCPLVQSIRPPKIKAQLVFWPASLYFKTTFGLSKEATSSRLQRGGYTAYLLLAKWDIIWKHCSEGSWHHKKGEKSAGEVDELYYKRKISSSVERSSLMISDVYYSGSRFKILCCRCVKMSVSSYFLKHYLFLAPKMCSHIENMKSIRNPVQFWTRWLKEYKWRKFRKFIKYLVVSKMNIWESL